MASTSHLGITLLEQSQAQKEITINEALARIDAVLNAGVVDRDLATPPGSPADGVVYIVATSPTGAWAGKAGHVAYFDQIWRFIEPKEGITLWVNDEDVQVVFNGTAWQVVTSGGGGGSGSDFATVVEGRLSAVSATPVPTSDVTAATTLYFTPYKGARIALYNGSAWELKSFSEISLAVPATTNQLYDVWAYISGGSVALDTTVWTNYTTRATALALQNGAYVKSGDATRRYIGTFGTTGVSGQTEDSKAKRFVWNYYNRVQRPMAAVETTLSWGYSTATWRQARGSTANQIDFVRGLAEDSISAAASSAVNSSTATARSVGTTIGENTTTIGTGRYGMNMVTNASYQNMHAFYDGNPGIGRHYLAWLERVAGSDTQTWVGESRFGLYGQLWG